MEDRSAFIKFTFGGLLIGILVFLALYFVPWENVMWGGLRLSAAKTVTVTGEAEKQERSQVATFVAGVTAVNDDKDAAISEVNSKITEIISSLKDFGIKDQDLKTQNLSINQNEQTYYEDGVQKQRPGQWRISNNIEIKLSDASRASSLASLLTKSGATTVYGPNFTLEDISSVQEELLKLAMEDARSKAQVLATLANSNLGEVVSVTEGTGGASVFQNIGFEGGGGGGGLQPGSGTASKTVTVVFELK